MQKKKNASYTYGQAMKDAKASYKKGAKSAEPEEAAPKKRRGRKKKSRMKKTDEDSE